MDGIQPKQDTKEKSLLEELIESSPNESNIFCAVASTVNECTLKEPMSSISEQEANNNLFKVSRESKFLLHFAPFFCFLILYHHFISQAARYCHMVANYLC